LSGQQVDTWPTDIEQMQSKVNGIKQFVNFTSSLQEITYHTVLPATQQT